MARSQRQQLGDHYERLALRHLQNAGLALVTRNFSCRCGELDLVLTDDQVLVIAEVRFRGRSAFEHAANSVTPGKQHRIVQTTEIFLQLNPAFDHHDIRFDVVAVNEARSPDDSGTVHIEWLRDAFRPGF